MAKLEAHQTPTFFDFHKPSLAEGRHTLTIEQAITPDTIAEHVPPIQVTFAVAGPKISIDPNHIHSMFPPPGSMGDHDAVLPHIILYRSTLPWERHGGKDTPWLMLLLFNEGEILRTDAMDFAQFKGTFGSEYDLTNAIVGEQDQPTRVTYIQVKRDLLNSITPTPAELQLLTHVRTLENAPSATQEPVELAVIMGNRLPSPGASSIAHLVSVEGRCTGDHLSGPADTVTLISLATWRFSCEPEGLSFKDQFLRLNRYTADAAGNASGITGSSYGLALPPTGDADLDPRLAVGCVLLRHRLRNGQKRVSWYRGPLSTTPSALAAPDDAVHADELLGYDASNDAFDVSYAAAWELGRMLTLRNKAISSQLFLWKCRYAHSLRSSRQQLVHHSTHHTVLPPDIPAPVVQWFDDLRSLRPLPFQYLIPHEGMLPQESIRFFRVDERWIDQLQAGAFTVGHVRSKNSDDLPDTPAENALPLFGLLLRSAAVTHWPHVEILGWSAASDDNGNDPKDDRLLNLVRREEIAPGILFCLFEGKTKEDLMCMVDIHKKPEALHYGFDKEHEKLTKHFRGQLNAFTLLVPGVRKVDIAGLATQAQASASAAFAVAMTEGVDRVRFIMST